MSRIPLGVVSGYRWGMLGAIGIALASTIFAAVTTGNSLLEPIAQLVMQLTPVSAANVLIQRLGVAARPLALMGALAVFMAAGGIVGALSVLAWRFVPHPLVAPHAGTPADRSAGEGQRGEAGGAGASTLGRPHPDPLSKGEGASRRRTLLDTAAIIGGAGAIAGVSVADATRRDRLVSLAGRQLFPFEAPAARVAGFPMDGQLPEVTPVSQFYIVSKNAQDPYVDASLWRLRVDGLAQRPFSITFDELQALQRVDQYVTVQCVSNPVGGSLMSNAFWSGAPLAALLERAGPLPAAGRVVFSAPDGHEESVPLEDALHTENVIAYAMNGELLTRLHGYPARALLPGLYGFKQVKWLTHIRLAPESHRGYWPRRGWTDDAVIRTTARIDLARMEGNQVRVAGMALAGRQSISRVEVRLTTAGDGRPGEWTQAELHTPPLSGMTWLQWRALLPISPGTGAIEVEARVVDGEGRPQETAHSGPFPNGSSGYHRVAVKA